MTTRPKLATCLWYDGTAEQAARFYCSLLPDSHVDRILPGPDGGALLVEFTLAGAPLQALNGGPHYRLDEAASLSVATEDQAETDRLWHALLAGGGTESQCGWLTDRFGLSWQLVPRALMEYLASPDPELVGRVMQAMLGMRRIDIAALDAAARGA